MNELSDFYSYRKHRNNYLECRLNCLVLSDNLITMQYKQAFDSIAGNTVVPYRSLKKFFNYRKLLFIAIYN